ncbi:MAG: ABC transporter permease, partial [Actinobacteria bacterium]|nr:ABC transporter permease [Actinomycetota bacterium]
MTGDSRQAAPVPPPGQGNGPEPAAGQPEGAAGRAGDPGEGQRGGRWLARRLITANETWTLLALIVLGAFFTIRAPGRFFTLSDFSLIAQNSAALLVMAVGQTFVILTAGIDLSVGAVLVLSGVVADLYYLHHGGTSASWVTIVVGAVIGVATGGGWGAVQGFLVAKARIVPLITTLAGFGAATGAS